MGRILLVASALLVSGCALPMPVKIASWAIDGISYIATKKSVADHGISIVAEKDCALLRTVTEGQICRDPEQETDTAVASAEELPEPVALEPMASEPEALPDFDTAAGEPEPALAPEVPASPDAPISPPETAAIQAAWVDFPPTPDPEYPVDAPAVAPEVVVAQAPVMAVLEPELPAALPEEDQGVIEIAEVVAVDSAGGTEVVAPLPEAEVVAPVPADMAVAGIDSGYYQVIGSFHTQGDAEDFARRHTGLAAMVLAGALDRQDVYRVVVGPFSKEDHPAVRRLVRQAKIYNSWATRIDPDRWSVAWTGDADSDGNEDLAALPVATPL